MDWNTKLNEWKNGIILKYPSNINKRFFYETSICNKNLTNNYNEEFIESNELENIKTQNYDNFIYYINNSKNIYVCSFYNISGDTKLIIPMPRKNKQYITIKDFIDNSSFTQQQEFWKFVYNEVKEYLKNNENVYISTHGLGVYYFHLRLCNKPKYYIGKLKN